MTTEVSFIFCCKELEWQFASGRLFFEHKGEKDGKIYGTWRLRIKGAIDLNIRFCPMCGTRLSTIKDYVRVE